MLYPGGFRVDMGSGLSPALKPSEADLQEISVDMNHLSSKWIASSLPGQESPLFRRQFSADDCISCATLHLCGLGYHEAWLNGQRVGDHVLDPAQTDYEKRVLYVSHDVTEMMLSGINAIGVMLGNGWYNQDRVWCKTGLSYGKPRLLVELHLALADGSTQVLGGDERWLCTAGPVTENNIYAGETYDARREQAGWSCPGFDDSLWHPVVIAAGPEGELEPQEMPPIRVVETLSPVSIRELKPGIHLVDMGQNFSGWAHIQVEAPRGTEIRMRFAECLSPDGGIDTASTGVFATGVEQVDKYICRGGGSETWEPRFTYHGFRYVEVTGWPGQLTANDIVGAVVHTDLPTAGSFECSDERLNFLHRMALWTHRSNIHGLPEDCPARERCGWLGDANMVAEFSMWNFQAKAFWEKYLDDIETSRSLNDGIPCDIAPGKRGTKRDANPDWAAAFIMLPWYLHVQCGDLAVLAKHWDGMERLMERFGEKADNWILEGGYGDWFDPGDESICTHTPPTLTTTFWFHHCATVMSSAAAALRRPDRSERYKNWASRIRDAVVAGYYRRDTASFGSQTANAMALQFELAPEGEETRVLDSLVRDIRQRNTHLSTGIMGVRYLFEVLSRYGHGELALALMHQDTYPSFGDLIQRGATTLWEYWGEEKHDKVHGPRSLNHPMMGGFDNWFYNTLAGISPDPAHPGFGHFLLCPHPISGLDWVRAHYDCPHGKIVSNWQFSQGKFEWNVAVPQGTSATAVLPFTRQSQVLKPGEHSFVSIKEIE